MKHRRYGPLSYLRDHLPALILALLAVGTAGVMALLLGAPAAGAFMLALIVALLIASMAVADYLRCASFLKTLQELTEAVSEPWLITRMMEEPESLEARICYEAIESVSAAASSAVEAHRRRWEDYCRYIELWIHEIKTPIATSRLVLESLHGPAAVKLERELLRIDLAVEQALYYARSTSLSNDYLIREQRLSELVSELCKRCAQLLIEQGVAPVIEIDPRVTVLTDRSWCEFVLGQAVSNAAKYGATRISFRSWEEDEDGVRSATVLEIADDGVGIAAADVPRVFERGFVGANGRRQRRATGMGLYLAALICERMGLGISLASEEGRGTRVLISFPHNRDLLGLQRRRLDTQKTCEGDKDVSLP